MIRNALALIGVCAIVAAGAAWYVLSSFNGAQWTTPPTAAQTKSAGSWGT